MGIFNWAQKALLEKWLGRIIVLGLAALSGFLIKQGLDQALVSTWVEATRPLLESLIPLILAWILGLIRHKIALNTEPPIR